jgi:hypothetical protein
MIAATRACSISTPTRRSHPSIVPKPHYAGALRAREGHEGPLIASLEARKARHETWPDLWFLLWSPARIELATPS